MGIGVSIRQAELLRQGARREHDAAQEARERKPSPGGPGWPGPVVPMRDAVSAELPSSPKAVDQEARRRGWLTRVTYAAGTSTTRYGDPGKLVESIAVRCARWDGDELTRVVMVWHRPWGVDDAAYRFTAAIIWGTTQRLRRTKLQDARDVIESVTSSTESREGTNDGEGVAGDPRGVEGDA